MKTEFECIPCIVNSYLKLAETDVIPEQLEEPVLRRLLTYLSEVDYKQSPPVMGRTLQHIIREALQNPDPYQLIKEEYNRKMLDLYPAFQQLVNSSSDPFDTAMRLAIAGNVIDFGAKYQFDIMETVKRVMNVELAVNDSVSLRKSLEYAKTLLYIGDNCGEIVLDKLFLSSINVPQKVYVVRGSVVLNDITMEDARMTGIDKITSVITTGDNAPGAVWESASEEFRDHFHQADVIISKGQGNLEGLIDIPHENIYFMLVTKCDLIAQKLGTQKGEYIVKKGITN